MKKIILYLLFVVPLITSGQAAFVAAKAVSASSISDSIQVNIWEGTVSNGQILRPSWQNWIPADIGFNQTTTSAALKDANGVTTSVTATLSGGPETDLQGLKIDNNGNSAGWGTGNTIGYPDTVFRIAYFFTTSGETSGTDTLIFNNLPTPSSGNFTIEIVSSRPTGTSRPQQFTCNGTTINLNAQNNLSTLLQWTNVPKSVGNQIKVIIQYTNSFSYINAFKIKWIP